MTLRGLPLLVATLLVSSTAFRVSPPSKIPPASVRPTLPCSGSAAFLGTSGQPSDAGMLFLRQARHTSRTAGCSRLVRAMSHSATEGGRGKANHLVNEKSPYLLHHVYNPVDWYPWGEEAFKKAKERDVPVLVSVGYSACHWCLVMARESFESEDVAALLNQHFVCIKVDREERPDVDAMLIKFLEQATGSAGWPMNVFLTPDLKPFTGGTYFPKERFAGIALRIHDAWENNREEVESQGDRVVDVFRRQLASEGASPSLTDSEAMLSTLIEKVRGDTMAQLREAFDAQHGGFGRGLKFPRPSVLNFLLRAHYVDPSLSDALFMALSQLLNMAKGGMRDHIGGGFHRYSTDPRWHVPHFEKMLYDQAQLVCSYLEAYQVTGDVILADVARDTLTYLLQTMRSPEGTFYSAESAESPDTGAGEAKEGAFYVWTKDEILTALHQHDKGDTQAAHIPSSPSSPADISSSSANIPSATTDISSSSWAEKFCTLMGVEGGGNVRPEDDPHGELSGQNVLYLTRAWGEWGAEERAVLERGRQALRQAQRRRVRPERDEKVVAGWNGLCLSALAKAHRVLGLPAGDMSYLHAAEQCAATLRATLYDEDSGELKRLSLHGVASQVSAMSDDYACLAKGLLDLFEATGHTHHLTWARSLQAKLDELFLCDGSAREGVGYLGVRRDDPAIAYLVKSTYDGAEPSVSSVGVHNLLRLSALTGDETRAQQAHTIMAALLQDPSAPYAVPELQAAALLVGDSLREVIITGIAGGKDTAALLSIVNRRFLPDTVLLPRLLPSPSPSPSSSSSPPSSEEESSLFPPSVLACGLVQGGAAARLCEAKVCSPPMLDPTALEERLNVKRRRGAATGTATG